MIRRTKCGGCWVIRANVFTLASLVLGVGVLVASGCARVSPAAPASGTSQTQAISGSARPAQSPMPDMLDEPTSSAHESVAQQSEDAADEAQPRARPSTSSTGDVAAGSVPEDTSTGDKASPDRQTGLGQFGGGRGGGGGGRGGGGGGRGGGGGFGGGQGGGGFGGGQGGGGFGGQGGGGGGGAGGVSIDPKIQLKPDSSGKLDQRRKEATSKKPDKGGFSSE